MSHVGLAAIHMLRASLVVALISASGTVIPAAGQPAPVQPKTPPRVPSPVNSSVTIVVGRLDPGQTIRQTFTPSPAPVANSVMSLTGEWPTAAGTGAEGQVNRKIRVVLISPFRQAVADGCGYSRTAQPTPVSPTTRPTLFASGQFAGGTQDASGPWTISVSYCDGASGPSRVLGEIRISISYRGAR